MTQGFMMDSSVISSTIYHHVMSFSKIATNTYGMKSETLGLMTNGYCKRFFKI